MTYLRFRLQQMLQRLWFLPAAFSLLAVLTVIGAYILARFAPDKLPFTIGSEAVQSILSVLASSMLTVAVFALSTIVSALSGVSSSTSPRAVPLISGDRSAQTSISVFVGAFLFSIVGIIGLSAGLYSEAGRMFLFLVTLGVVVLVVAALIRWIGQISAIGLVSNTVDAVEAATRRALETMAEHPLLNGQRLEDAGKGAPIYASRPGYVAHCDAEHLQKLCEEHDLVVSVMARPGAHATPVRPLLLVDGVADEDLKEQLRDCFVVENARSYDADPRFGFIVLGEIADRALSPGINDPGTAIDVIDTATRLLLEWQDEVRGGEFDRVFVAPLKPADVLVDVYRPLSRDGAGIVEVVMRLMHSLETVAACQPSFRVAARSMARDALERANAALTAQSDKDAVAEVARWIDAH